MNARMIFPMGRRYRLARRPSEAIRPSLPRPVRRDCHGRLIAALLDRAGLSSDVTDDRMTPWASATFVGARHELMLVLTGDNADTRATALTALLPEADFAIPGHLIADLAIESREDEGAGAVRLRLSILTIEQW